MHFFESNDNNILAVDHGNYAVKTPDIVFKSGLRADTLAPAMDEDYISYKDLKWTCADEIPDYSRTKTEDDTLFVQTLFAAAKEAKAGNLDLSKPIHLAIGLPPMHMRTEKKEYEKYFRQRSTTRLIFNGKGTDIMLEDVHVFPQGLSAITYAVTAANEKKSDPVKFVNYPSLLIVDIGGGTADVIYIRDGKPVTSLCKSYELGTNFLIESIENSLTSNVRNINVSFRIVEDIIMGRPNIYTIDPTNEESKQVLSIKKKEKRNHVQKLLSRIGMDISDVKSIPCIYEGGGSALLKDEITSDRMEIYRSRYYQFLTDTHLNACGYRYLTELALRS